jgi:uncharacterized protein (UPF0261 family)
VISAPGGPFYSPEADTALFEALTHNLRPQVQVISMDCDVNSSEFAIACANALLQNMVIA